jgi:hypothetical protein
MRRRGMQGVRDQIVRQRRPLSMVMGEVMLVGPRVSAAKPPLVRCVRRAEGRIHVV